MTTRTTNGVIEGTNGDMLVLDARRPNGRNPKGIVRKQYKDELEKSAILKTLYTAATSGEGRQADYKTYPSGKIRRKIGFTSPEIEDDLVTRRLQLFQSINRFDKSKDLRKTITRDKSVPNFGGELLHQLSIKSFDESKLKPMDPSEPSGPHSPDASNSHEPTWEDNTTDGAAAPNRSQLMHRRHTVNVALSATEISDISDLSRSREPSVSSLEGCSD